MSAAGESFAERLRREAEEKAGLELMPWSTDGPRLVGDAGFLADGSPGPALVKRMAKDGYVWMGDAV